MISMAQAIYIRSTHKTKLIRLTQVFCSAWTVLPSAHVAYGAYRTKFDSLNHSYHPSRHMSYNPRHMCPLTLCRCSSNFQSRCHKKARHAA